MTISYSSISLFDVGAYHTWINKINEIPTISRSYFEQGKKIHSIVQRHCSGVETNPLLVNLPSFSRVETSELDKNMEVSTKYRGYFVHGYVDMIDDTRQEFCDIKSGAPWSVKKMASHKQFQMYSWMLGYNKFMLINLPKEIEKWNKNNIVTMSMEFTSKHHDNAKAYIDKAIHVIENINEYIAIEDFSKTKYSCNYQHCLWGCNDRRNN